jgi:hypothetical protein
VNSDELARNAEADFSAVLKRMEEVAGINYSVATVAS